MGCAAVAGRWRTVGVVDMAGLSTLTSGIAGNLEWPALYPSVRCGASLGGLGLVVVLRVGGGVRYRGIDGSS